MTKIIVIKLKKIPQSFYETTFNCDIFYYIKLKKNFFLFK